MFAQTDRQAKGIHYQMHLHHLGGFQMFLMPSDYLPRVDLTIFIKDTTTHSITFFCNGNAR